MAAATCVPDLLRTHRAKAADRVALVVEGGAELTYRDWDQRSDAAAAGLGAAGVRHGDRVALCFDNLHLTDYAVCYLAVLKAGAAAVPLSPSRSGPELERVARHAAVALLVCHPERLPPGDLGPVAHPAELEAGRDPDGPRSQAGPEDLAEIIYTSGTTGRPKGVACSHGNLLAHDLPAEAAGPVAFLHAFPVGTNAGQECLRMPLRRIATAVVLPDFEPERLCAAVADRRIRRLQLVPAMGQLVVESGAAANHDLSSVERVTLSSAPAPPALWDDLAATFPNAALWNAYALTEAGGARTATRYDPARPGSVGRPVGESEARVVDADGRALPGGETGEVWLRRRGAPRREYFRDPAATAAAFAGDWVRTGDLGHLDADGHLVLSDRKKDVIVSGGLNVASVEVENALSQHPAVAQAAVFGVDHRVLGQDVAAAVVARAPTDARELQAFVRGLLAEHKVPRRVHFLDRLPRTDSGKVIKRELRELFAAPPPDLRERSATAPTEPEATVAAVWRELLDLADVGLHEDFFELGGHSLAAAQVVARLQDAFDVELPVTAVFEAPTVAELAAAVVDALTEPSAR